RSLAQHDLAHDLIVRQHRDHRVHPVRRVHQRRSRLAAVLRHERLHYLRPYVIDRDVEALLHEVAGHGRAHVADADEAHFLDHAHDFLLKVTTKGDDYG